MKWEDFIKNNPPLTGEQQSERGRAREEFIALRNAEAKPLVDALSTAWRPVNSIGELLQTSEPYPQAIPVLVDHLRRPYHASIKDVIARALTVKEARGPLAQIVLEELKSMDAVHNSDEEGYRFALANALVTIGDSSMQTDVVDMMNNPRYAEIAVELKRVIKAIAKRKPS
jgi:hypothetical protein